MSRLRTHVRGRGSDVQLEFVMLDPYVRTTLKHNGKVSSRREPRPCLGSVTVSLLAWLPLLCPGACSSFRQVMTWAPETWCKCLMFEPATMQTVLLICRCFDPGHLLHPLQGA